MLVSSIPPQGSPYHAILKAELENLRGRSDGFLYHAYLDVVNRPLYFHQFVQRAAAVGLRYLGDAQSGWRWSPPLATNVESSLIQLADDHVEREQLTDFIVNQSSRYSLLCHGEARLHEEPAGDGLKPLYVSAHVTHETTRLDPVGNACNVFRTPSGRSITTSDPNLNAALTILAGIWPLRLAFVELDNRIRSAVEESYAQEWYRGLLDCHRAGIVELNADDAKYATQVDQRPRTTSYARRQAESGNIVTNLRHAQLRLNDVDRAVVRRLDGTNTHAGLADFVAETVSRAPTSSASDSGPHEGDNATSRSLIRDSLTRLAKNAMLTSDEAGGS